MATSGRLGAKGARPAVLILAGDAGPTFHGSGIPFAVADRQASFATVDRAASFQVPDRQASFQVTG